MSSVKRFEELECWKAAREMVKEIYKICNYGKLKKDFDTRNQFRRAALSTMNNIAEGFGRYSKVGFIKFLAYSQSSASEVKRMLYVLEDLEYLEDAKLNELHEHTDMTRNYTLALIRYLRKSK